MAQIELRNATIRLVDGHSNTGLVNDTIVSGDATMDIDTLGTAGEIAVGTRFTVVGNSKTHYVTAQNKDEVQRVTVDATAGNFTLGFTGTVANPIATQTTANIAENASAAAVQSALEALAAIDPGDVLVTGSAGGPWDVQFTGQYAGLNMGALIGTNVSLTGGTATVTVTTINQGGSTRQITFTPTIVTADGIPADNAVITFGGRTLEIKVGEGNLTYNEQREFEYTLDRGNLDTVRELDQQPLEVSLDFIWEFLAATGTAVVPTIEDVFKKRGPAASWTSSSSDPCEPFAVDVEIEYVPPCGGEQREIITLPDFRWESLDHNIQDASVAVSGRCNAIQATVARAA